VVSAGEEDDGGDTAAYPRGDQELNDSGRFGLTGGGAERSRAARRCGAQSRAVGRRSDSEAAARSASDRRCQGSLQGTGGRHRGGQVESGTARGTRWRRGSDAWALAREEGDQQVGPHDRKFPD
jgi:hypothetical protein